MKKQFWGVENYLYIYFFDERYIFGLYNIKPKLKPDLQYVLRKLMGSISGSF